MERRKTFGKAEHLCLDKQINSLFSHGKWLRSNHLRFVFHTAEEEIPVSAQVLFSVPKKLHRKAVKRNLIKRRLREAYRHNKFALIDILAEKNIQLYLGFVYSNDKIPEYRTIEREMKLLLSQLISRIEKGFLS
jgi:ribonuclease P protein component